MNAPEQRSPEWFAQRAKLSITGSMVGSVLGLNPYSNRDKALREKVREKLGAEREFKGNKFTEWGTEHEPIAQKAFEEETGHIVREAPLVLHPECDWAGASPDGWVGRSGLLEIKCPNPDYPIKDAKEQPHYLAQIQLQLHVTRRTKCYFYRWQPSATRLDEIDIDLGWWDEHYPTLLEFHEEVMACVEDPELAARHLEDLEVSRVDDLFLAQEQKLIKAKEIYEDAKLDYDNCRKTLIAMAGNKKAVGKELQVIPVKQQGRIDYEKAIKELLPEANLSNYRKSPSTTYQIRKV